MNTKEYLIIHHTGGTDANPLADTSHHTAKIVDEYHKSKGWDGIGYNYFIEKDGKTVIGRNIEKTGAHTIGYNDKSIGICLAGNFDATLPTLAQEKALTILLNELRIKYQIPVQKIVPHRTFANKSCYGRRLADDWAQKMVEPIISKATILNEIDRLRKLVEKL